MLEQGLKHADGGIERRARRAVRGLAVPAAIGQLFSEQAVDDTANVLAKVRADRAHLPIDTGLQLTGEEGIVITFLRAATFPGHTVMNERDRTARMVARWIEAHLPQQDEHVHRGVPSPVPRRTAPSSIGPLKEAQLRAHTLGGDPGALGRDLRRWRASQVPHHLPADRRVRIKQPPHDQAVLLAGRQFSWSGGHLVVGVHTTGGKDSAQCDHSASI